MPEKNNTIGLALGSGSARGLAHIGVIHALEEAGITIDVVAGTSIGALIGSVFAAGKLEAIERDYLEFDWKKIAYFFDVVFPRSGLIDGTKVANFVQQYITSNAIENLPLPFHSVATDIGTGEEIVFKQGDIIEAVQASISAPGIFTPVRFGERILVDGGLVNPVPVSVAKSMGADLVVAVDLNHDIVAGKSPLKNNLNNPTNHTNESVQDHDNDQPQNGFSRALSNLGGEKYQQAMARINRQLGSFDSPTLKQIRAWLDEEPLPNIFEIMLASINIMENQITKTRLRIDPPDLLIRPPLGSIRFLEFHRAEEIINIGYQETKKQLQQSDIFR